MCLYHVKVLLVLFGIFIPFIALGMLLPVLLGRLSPSQLLAPTLCSNTRIMALLHLFHQSSSVFIEPRDADANMPGLKGSSLCLSRFRCMHPHFT